uniref:Uncharacterized protein n=1 Tax=Cyanoderma ruficeps TaxID=181631 RepID=A0A8C3QH28_9PASS
LLQIPKNIPNSVGISGQDQQKSLNSNTRFRIWSEFRVSGHHPKSQKRSQIQLEFQGRTTENPQIPKKIPNSAGIPGQDHRKSLNPNTRFRILLEFQVRARTAPPNPPKPTPNPVEIPGWNSSGHHPKS